MVIAIGCDHAGFALMQALKEYALAGHRLLDMGTHDESRTDYPRYALAVAKAVTAGEADRGILVCGTGIGMAIAASRVRGIRAAVCTNEYTARVARAHNNANVLCLGGRVVGSGVAEGIVQCFLDTQFAAGRHADRLTLIDDQGD
ncbi:MAG: ribose 5-phosphate isomerase B [Candidatus Bipolaricaulota bacterium]